MKQILPLLMLLAIISSCKKNELRSTTYTLRSFNGTPMIGTVSFQETSDASQTNVHLEIHGMIPDSTYMTHLHEGTLGHLTNTFITFKGVKSSTGSYSTTQTWNKGYDDALKSNTCVTVHNPTFFSNDTIGYVLGANTGANAQ
ncbi:MAG: hypothetical protein U0T84_10065 [Chitinophagales bacterium]